MPGTVKAIDKIAGKSGEVQVRRQGLSRAGFEGLLVHESMDRTVVHVERFGVLVGPQIAAVVSA